MASPANQNMQQLSIRLLGWPTIFANGHAITFPTRKALALFIYLVVEDDVQPREKLMDLLWPDSDTRSAQASLRNALARLRKSLGASNSIILVTQETIAFDKEADVALDLSVLRAAVTHIQESPQSLSPTLLQAAVDVYQGEFIASFGLRDTPDFEHWETVQREMWHRQLGLIFEHLMQHHLKHLDIDKATTTAQRWVTHNPLDEAAQRSLMQSYFLAGDRHAAMSAYKACQTLLVNELGVQPAPETTKLAEMIRQTEPAERRQPRSKQTPVGGQPSLPFVGRAYEFAQLVAAYRMVEGGTMQAVSVVGESGIGKTRLVAEFLRWVRLQGGDILQSSAFEAGGQLPYQAIVGALRERLSQENAPEDLLDDVWLAELTRLLPELLDRYPDLRHTLVTYDNDPTTARMRLYEAVARLGEAWSRQRTLVFFLDDWMWADQASIDMLHYLGQNWALNRAPILVILNMRSEDLSTNAILTKWLVAWERFSPMNYLWLKRLTAKDALSFVETWFKIERDSDAVRQLSDRLYRETAGNPFFLVETVQYLADQTADASGAIDHVEVLRKIEKGLTLPPNIRKVVLSRLAKLDETATSLMVAAAVLGRNCRFEEMCLVSGVDELEGLPALDTLLDSEVIVESGDSRHPYIFAHNNIRDVAYTEAGRSRRRIFHRSAFIALKQIAAPPTELAYHAEQAQLFDEARLYLRQAGDAASAVYQHGLADEYYDRALALTPESAAGNHLQ